MINIGTIVLCFIIIRVFLRGRTINNILKRLFSLTCIVELNIERGYFIRLGSQLITYRTVCEGVLFLVCLIFLLQKRTRVKRVLLIRVGFVVAVLFIGLFHLILFPSNATGATMDVSWDMILVSGYSRQPITYVSSMTIEIIQVVMFLVVVVAVYSSFEKTEWIEVLLTTVKVSRIIIFCGVVELFVNYINGTDLYYKLIDLILGKSLSTYSSLQSRGNGIMLCGLTKEGSHYVFVLTVIFVLNVALHKFENSKEKKYYVSQVAILLLMFFSMSFSTLYYFISIIMLMIGLHYAKKGNSSIKVLITIVIGIVLSLTFVAILPLIANFIGIESFWGRRMFSLIEELNNIKNGSWLSSSSALEWSTRVRLGSTYETLKLIWVRPIFGLGFASTSAHSSLAMLVSGLGIVGTILYLKLMSYGKKIKICVYNERMYLIFIAIYLFMNLLNSLSLRPFYEMWTLLLFVVVQLLMVDKNYSMHEHECYENNEKD